MITAIARIDLDLPGCRSLKEKRQIVRSLVERVRGRFQVAAAEVEDQDLWNRAVLGIAYVSAGGPHAREVVEKAIRFIGESTSGAEMLDAQIELVEPF